MPTYEVELTWREGRTYEVEAPDEDTAITQAMARARLETDEDEFELEGVGEVEDV